MEFTEEVDQFLDSQFAQKLSDPTAWAKHAKTLIASARISKEHASSKIDQIEKADLEDVCSMLYGLALENMFKAIWIYREFGIPYSENWLPQTKFPKEINGHNLLILAEKIDLGLAKEYDFYLESLTEAVIWAGRYPCKLASDSKAKPGSGFFVRCPDMHEKAEEIYTKLSHLFRADC